MLWFRRLAIQPCRSISCCCWIRLASAGSLAWAQAGKTASAATMGALTQLPEPQSHVCSGPARINIVCADPPAPQSPARMPEPCPHAPWHLRMHIQSLSRRVTAPQRQPLDWSLDDLSPRRRAHCHFSVGGASNRSALWGGRPARRLAVPHTWRTGAQVSHVGGATCPQAAFIE